jgi:hypothetical protein
MDGRSLWRPRGDPVFQRLKQVTNVLAVDALADLESTTADIVANGR